jgi:hypothetical protein
MNMEKLTLNQKSCELLDSLLQAFGDGVHLKRPTILKLFDGDENEAVKHINILSQLGYIKKMAEMEGQKLGEIFYKNDSADLFLMQGGFTARYLKAAEEKISEDNRQSLVDENTKLQNEALKHQATIREQEDRIRSLDEKLKRFEMLKNYEWLIRLSIAFIVATFTWWINNR